MHGCSLPYKHIYKILQTHGCKKWTNVGKKMNCMGEGCSRDHSHEVFLEHLAALKSSSLLQQFSHNFFLVSSQPLSVCHISQLFLFTCICMLLFDSSCKICNAQYTKNVLATGFNPHKIKNKNLEKNIITIESQMEFIASCFRSPPRSDFLTLNC